MTKCLPRRLTGALGAALAICMAGPGLATGRPRPHQHRAVVGDHAHAGVGRVPGPRAGHARRSEDHRVPGRTVQGGGPRACGSAGHLHTGRAAGAHAGAGRCVDERDARRRATRTRAAEGHGGPRPAPGRPRDHRRRAAGLRRLRRGRTRTPVGRLQGRRPQGQGRRLPDQRSGLRGTARRRRLRQVRRQGRDLLRALDLQVRRGRRVAAPSRP